MVWIGTADAVAPVPKPSVPSDGVGYYDGVDYSYVEPTSPDDPVRAHFRSPQVAYVGSHTGCGCGFNSGLIAWEGFELVADAMELLAAMTDDERNEFLAEQRSRVRLQELVRGALARGSVEIYACDAGGEADKPKGEQAIDLGWLTERTEPLVDGLLYSVSRSA